MLRFHVGQGLLRLLLVPRVPKQLLRDHFARLPRRDCFLNLFQCRIRVHCTNTSFHLLPLLVLVVRLYLLIVTHELNELLGQRRQHVLPHPRLRTPLRNRTLLNQFARTRPHVIQLSLHSRLFRVRLADQPVELLTGLARLLGRHRRNILTEIVFNRINIILDRCH